ncbi:MAG: hypothetical protein ACREKH_07975, partial [Candidatus Rokuibacteriota bacterium]
WTLSLMLRRAILAEVLHQVGRVDEALEHFRKAEALQAWRQPETPLLYAVQGFHYCDLLLACAERAAGGGLETRGTLDACGTVERRASQTLAWIKHQDWILDNALDHLTLGRARLYRAILGCSAVGGAKREIDEAVEGLRRSGHQDYLPRGLLTRAWLCSALGDPDGARADLAEAEEIAERGPMPLHLADVHLYRARLFHDRAALAEAWRLVEKHGYWRRREELKDLEAVAGGW